MWITDWTARAACKGTDPDELFVQGAAQNRAKLICRGCPSALSASRTHSITESSSVSGAA